jgi:hypothetical protein
LRFNPFGERPLAERSALAIVDIQDDLAFLRRERAALVFRAHPGRGKTTHLLALRAALDPQAPYVHLREGEAIPKIPAAPLLFIDELQRLPISERWRLFQNPGRLVIGTHSEHRAGLLLSRRPVRLRRLRGLDAARLRAIVERRIESARRSVGPVPELDDLTLNALIRRHGDSVRAIEHELYELFQTLAAPGRISLAHSH